MDVLCKHPPLSAVPWLLSYQVHINVLVITSLIILLKSNKSDYVLFGQQSTETSSNSIISNLALCLQLFHGPFNNVQQLMMVCLWSVCGLSAVRREHLPMSYPHHCLPDPILPTPTFTIFPLILCVVLIPPCARSVHQLQPPYQSLCLSHYLSPHCVDI